MREIEQDEGKQQNRRKGRNKVNTWGNIAVARKIGVRHRAEQRERNRHTQTQTQGHGATDRNRNINRQRRPVHVKLT